MKRIILTLLAFLCILLQIYPAFADEYDFYGVNDGNGNVFCSIYGNSVVESAYFELKGEKINTLFAAGAYCTSYANGVLGSSDIVINNGEIKEIVLSAAKQNSSQTGISIGENLNLIINGGSIGQITYYKNAEPQIMGALNIIFNNDTPIPSTLNYPKETVASGVYIIKSGAGGTVLPTENCGEFIIQSYSESTVAQINGKLVQNGTIYLNPGNTTVKWVASGKSEPSSTNNSKSEGTAQPEVYTHQVEVTTLTIGKAEIVSNGIPTALDVPAQIVNSRTMVPLRAIFEALGATVEWDDGTKTVTSSKNGTTIKMTIGKANINIDGVDKTLDIAPEIIDGRTLVPVRAVAEGLNAKVEWDEEVRTVSIFLEDSYAEKMTVYKPNISKTIGVHLLAAYKENGWYEFPVITLYSVNGGTIVVGTAEAGTYKKAGWYEQPMVTMYAADGRTTVVASSEIDAQKQLGWYEFPVATMYLPDGSTIVVGKGEIEAYKAVGWYEFPVITLYKADGSSIVVGTGEVATYKSAGWYTSVEAANDHQTNGTTSSQNVVFTQKMFNDLKNIIISEGVYLNNSYNMYYKSSGTNDIYWVLLTYDISEDDIVIYFKNEYKTRTYSAVVNIKRYDIPTGMAQDEDKYGNISDIYVKFPTNGTYTIFDSTSISALKEFSALYDAVLGLMDLHFENFTGYTFADFGIYYSKD